MKMTKEPDGTIWWLGKTSRCENCRAQFVLESGDKPVITHGNEGVVARMLCTHCKYPVKFSRMSAGAR
jgi:hypothetical protein